MNAAPPTEPDARYPTTAAGPIRDVLAMRDLKVGFHTSNGLVGAVNGVSYSLGQSETIGVVGESGSGKSVMALSVLRLLPHPPAVTTGSIRFRGEEVLSLPPDMIRKLRGNSISMIFQEPMTSLNPVMTIGDQISEVFLIHTGASRREAFERSVEMLTRVRIPEPGRRMRNYPHQLSGGMRQRVMIAMALACQPLVLLADEPTTALDVTIQAQIAELIRNLSESDGTGILLISHNMGLVADMCDRVIVMYAGRVMEEAPVQDLFQSPQHPYTQGLLASVPRLRRSPAMPKIRRLSTIRGGVPNLLRMPTGCPFYSRCEHALPVCSKELPPMLETESGHKVSCWLHVGTCLRASEQVPAVS